MYGTGAPARWERVPGAAVPGPLLLLLDLGLEPAVDVDLAEDHSGGPPLRDLDKRQPCAHEVPHGAFRDPEVLFDLPFVHVFPVFHALIITI